MWMYMIWVEMWNVDGSVAEMNVHGLVAEILNVNNLVAETLTVQDLVEEICTCTP